MQFGAHAESRVFVLWFGPALAPALPMSVNRLRGLDSVRSHIGLEVILITEENVDEWVVPDAPLHPAFRWLSAVHKADYLRSYLMHHQGGGYTDVKQIRDSWAPSLNVLNTSPRLLGVGYPEPGALTVATMVLKSGRSKARRVVDRRWLTHRVLQHQYRKLIGTSAFLFRPGSAFTSAWFSRVTHRMDRYAGQLESCPARHPLDRPGLVENGVTSNYPIPWTDLLGNIFHPLSLRYNRKLANSLPAPDFTDYR